MWVQGWGSRVTGSSRAKEGSSHSCELVRGLFPRLVPLSSQAGAFLPGKPGVVPHLRAPTVSVGARGREKRTSFSETPALCPRHLLICSRG